MLYGRATCGEQTCATYAARIAQRLVRLSDETGASQHARMCYALRAHADGQKAGGADALKQAAGGGKMTLDEARKILGIEQGAAWDAVEKVRCLRQAHARC
jgi:hypothetical protein